MNNLTEGEDFTIMNRAILFLQKNTICKKDFVVVMAAGTALINI